MCVYSSRCVLPSQLLSPDNVSVMRLFDGSPMGEAEVLDMIVGAKRLLSARAVKASKLMAVSRAHLWAMFGSSVGGAGASGNFDCALMSRTRTRAALETMKSAAMSMYREWEAITATIVQKRGTKVNAEESNATETPDCWQRR